MSRRPRVFDDVRGEILDDIQPVVNRGCIGQQILQDGFNTGLVAIAQGQAAGQRPQVEVCRVMFLGTAQ